MSSIELGNQHNKRQLLLIPGQILALKKPNSEYAVNLVANDVVTRSSQYD
jgi:hypothetical protein